MTIVTNDGIINHDNIVAITADPHYTLLLTVHNETIAIAGDHRGTIAKALVEKQAIVELDATIETAQWAEEEEG